MSLYLFGLYDMSNFTFIFEIFVGDQVRVTKIFPRDFLESILEEVVSILYPQCGKTFYPMQGLVRDVDLFHVGTKPAALGSLLAQGWVLIKDS